MIPSWRYFALQLLSVLPEVIWRWLGLADMAPARVGSLSMPPVGGLTAKGCAVPLSSTAPLCSSIVTKLTLWLTLLPRRVRKLSLPSAEPREAKLSLPADLLRSRGNQRKPELLSSAPAPGASCCWLLAGRFSWIMGSSAIVAGFRALPDNCGYRLETAEPGGCSFRSPPPSFSRNCKGNKFYIYRSLLEL